MSEITPGLGKLVGGVSREEPLPGLIPSLLLLSDCCDGTDEYNSGIVCENTCKYVAGSCYPPPPPLPSPGSQPHPIQ